MRAQLPKREPTILARWETENLYETLREQAKGRPQYMFHDGPPYANGALHVGHAVNKVLKDIVTKSRTLSGFDAPFVPGWDCHGLPIELNVEKKLGKKKRDLSDAEFRDACRQYAAGQIESQKAVLQRLGVLADWKNPYLTLKPTYEANTIRALAKIVENGHLQHGLRPVHWCMNCASSLAEAEVEYKDKASPAVDVAFDAIDVPAVLKAFGIADAKLQAVRFPIWTTTPWTLPANRAVAVHPEFNYQLIQVSDQAFVVAADLSEAVAARYGWSEQTVLAETTGEALTNLQLHHPLLDRVVPVLCGEHVTVDAGTGLVHTAPAHGLEDYALGLEAGLPIEGPVDHRGCYHASAELLPGEHVLKANPKIVDMLRESGHLLAFEEIQHSYPHCWRHKTPVIFRATPQWFVSMEAANLRQDALDAIKAVQWQPAWGEKRISNMIAGRPDWCISRQRKWGTPIALIVHKETGDLHPDMPNLMRKIADSVQAGGLEAWFGAELDVWLGSDAENWLKVPDTLDVWFDAGVSHTCVLEAREELSSPANLYLEGSDQYRGWFHSSLLTGVAMDKAAPYKAVVSHGYTVDAHGRKMSKSIGNILPAHQAIEDHGADVLRLWVASTDYTNDMTVSDEQFKRTSDAYRRIRNTLRYLLSNLSDFEFARDAVSGSDLLALDQWAIAQVVDLQTSLCQAYETHQFHQVYKQLLHFCSITMGSFYLDILKDRLYTMRKNSRARRSAQTALYHILHTLVPLMAPVLSFTAEEVWQYLPDQAAGSVFLSSWYQAPIDAAGDSELTGADWAAILKIRASIYQSLEQARNDGQIGSALEAHVKLYAAPELYTLLNQLGDELRFVLITSGADVFPEADRTEGAEAAEDQDGLWIEISVAPGEKCQRCWHRREDVDADARKPGLCGRCVNNVAGEGEARKFA